MSINISFNFILDDRFELKDAKKIFDEFGKPKKIDKKDFLKWEMCSVPAKNSKMIYIGYTKKASEHSINIFTDDGIQWNDLKELGMFYELIKKLYFDLKCRGYGKQENEEEKEYEIFGNSFKDLKIWSVNLFTPQEVKKYGREKLLKAPCEFIEEWEDGAIFMMINRNNFASTYEKRKKLRKYLGEKNE